MAGKSVATKLSLTNTFFKSKIDLVPPSFYFDKSTSEKITQKRNDHIDNKMKHSARKSSISNKAKLKRARLDPTENKKVSEFDLDALDRSESDSENPSSCFTSMKKPAGGNLDGLRKKLEEKRLDLEARRRKHLTSEQYREKVKLKRKEAKLKSKSKKKAAKEKVLAKRDTFPTPAFEIDGNNNNNSNKAEKKVAFSKFEFSQSAMAASKSTHKKKKNIKALLKDIETKKMKQQKLYNTEPEKAKEQASKQSWKSVLDKAKGVNPQDDEVLLKKTLKKQEQKKKKSRKEWQDRIQHVEDRKGKRQEKRVKNIKQKKDSRINKKITKAKKRGRILPGF